MRARCSMRPCAGVQNGCMSERCRKAGSSPFLPEKTLGQQHGTAPVVALSVNACWNIVNFRSGVIPHLWDDYGKVEWYAYHPTAADYAALRDAVGQYLSAFRERTPELERSGPKLVYICAPLRGDVANNVEFARQKAREVFVEGNIPICPHLLFPPVADPDDPAQDEKARAMGLRLLESCQQMNVYGPVWTDGMWQEIYKAGELGIPVLTDQKTIGRTPPARHPKRKER